MKKVFLGAAMASALLASCGTGNKLADIAGEWKIVSVDNEKVMTDNGAFIGFNIKEGRMYGNAGCNNMMASMKVDARKSAISFSEVGSTRKMCPDMKLENKILSSLKKVSAYKSLNDGIALTDNSGNIIFKLSEKADDKCSINGEWLISVAGGKAVKTVEKVPFIVIDADKMKVYGNGGCNLFNGSLSLDEDNSSAFKFGHLNRTMKAGPGLDQEDVIMSALEKTSSYELKNADVIVLKDSGDKVVAVLKKNKGRSLSK